MPANFSNDYHAQYDLASTKPTLENTSKQGFPPLVHSKLDNVFTSRYEKNLSAHHLQVNLYLRVVDCYRT